jgi:LuxR family transcriptional regulator, quorum-sensing system regulator BjaR1
VSSATVDYARSAFDLIDELDRVTTVEQVADRFGSALSSLGYSAFLITGVPEPPARVEPHFVLNGWPLEFTEHYARKNYYVDDPVAAWCRRSMDPFEWSQAPFDPTTWPRAAEVMNVAAEFGMRQGFCVPIATRHGFQSCVTMAGELPDFDPQAKRAAQFLGLYAHARSLALSEVEKVRRHPDSSLTDREREALSWTAAGKSSWEISVILGVSERTVNWFIANAGRKLGAVNRTQAVVNAIRAGAIAI